MNKILSLLIILSNFFYPQIKSDFYISDNQGNKNPTVSYNYPFVNGDYVGLTANYPAYKRIDKYIVSAPYSSSKTVIKEILDDEFTLVLDWPFTFCCFDGKDDISENLEDYTKEMLVSPLDRMVKGPMLFDNYQSAIADDYFLKTIDPNQLITDDGDLVSKTFYVRYENSPVCNTIISIFYEIFTTK